LSVYDALTLRAQGRGEAVSLEVALVGELIFTIGPVDVVEEDHIIAKALVHRVGDTDVDGSGAIWIADRLVLTYRVEEVQALAPEGDAFTAAICGAILTLSTVKVRDAVVVAKAIGLTVGPAWAIKVVHAKVLAQAIFRAEGVGRAI